MATLTNPLHIKTGNIIYECVCYTTIDEATPITIQGGSAWEVVNNGTRCYLGLWPIDKYDNGGYHSPLTVKKNNIEYCVETKVVNFYEINIVQSLDQTITVICDGIEHTEPFNALAGSYYTVVVTPREGYVAGEPSTSFGYVNKNMIIYASPASIGTHLVTIIQTAGQNIEVICNGITYNSTFAANYGDEWRAVLTPDVGYTAGTLNATSGTITEAITISATAATIIKYTVSVTQPENGIITVNNAEGTSFSINHGTDVTIKAIANEGYKVNALYVD